jgi:hypothetical protein
MAFSVVTAVPGMLSLGRDLRIANDQPIQLGTGWLEDDGGAYTIGWADGPFWFNQYWKDYVDGPRAGERVMLDSDQFSAEQAKMRAKYGYYDWKGELIEGTVPPRHHIEGMLVDEPA